MRTICLEDRRSGSRYSATCIMAALLGGLGAGIQPAFADPPNIIVIIADDLGTEAIEGAAWGNELECHTPNLARWASEGRMFSNARVYPVCSPTRAALMTGREAHRTGVVGVLWPDTAEPTRRALSLQPQERTIAEALREADYNTILIDKWHLAWDEGAGLMPEEQGFDVFHDYLDTMHLDDPIAVGDEHISLSVDQAIDAVRNRQRRSDPYALFFSTIDPHQRDDPSRREDYLWWKVDDRLLPSGENYYAPHNESNRNRYRAVVESLDTELFRLLHELDVVDSQGRYRRSSDTVVFFLADNGTPRQVSVAGPRAKGSVFDRGTRVPLFVFGEDVPDDGAIEDRLVSAVDLYETIADVAELGSWERGSAPRDSRSFADRIGYDQTGEDRRVSISVDGHADNPALSRAAITNGRFKLIARGGGPGLARLSGDEFYDLIADPEETTNLVVSGMNTNERSEFFALRDELCNQWPSAVSARASIQVDIPIEDIMWIDEEDNQGTNTLPLGFYHPGRQDEREFRVLVKFDVERLDRLMPPNKSIDDMVAAQILFGFSRESAESDETDTGVITIHPMVDSWSSSGGTQWRDVNNEYDAGQVLGRIDFAPHIIPDPRGSRQFGVPIAFGTPVSFGQSDDLIDQVQEWYDRPWRNDGVILIAEPLPGVDGDQRVFLMNRAAIRITLE